MNIRMIGACLGASTIASGAFAVTIDFDDLTPDTIVTNQYATATFSSSAGNANFAEDQNLGSSLPNFLCTGPDTGGINCIEDTYVDFTNPVNNLSFLAIGVNDSGKVAEVNIYVNNVFDSTIDVIGDGTAFSPDLVSIAQSNVTRIEIVSITDTAGIGWDDFTFDPVPEPASMAALALGSAVLLRRRKK